MYPPRMPGAVRSPDERRMQDAGGAAGPAPSACRSGDGARLQNPLGPAALPVRRTPLRIRRHLTAGPVPAVCVAAQTLPYIYIQSVMVA